MKILYLPALCLFSLTIACEPRNATPLDNLEDGEYLGTFSHFDGRGWAPFLHLIVDDGEAVSLTFDLVNAAGTFATEHEGYAAHFATSSGVELEEAIRSHVDSLRDNGVVPVSGAPGTEQLTEAFNELAEGVLERAREGDTRIFLVPMTAEYHAEGEPDDEGWVARIEVRYEGRTLVGADFDRVRLEDGEIVARRSEDDGYLEAWREETGREMDAVVSRLSEQLHDEGRPAGVDIISGATATSRSFRNLANEAIETREPVDFTMLLEQL